MVHQDMLDTAFYLQISVKVFTVLYCVLLERIALGIEMNLSKQPKSISSPLLHLTPMLLLQSEW